MNRLRARPHSRRGLALMIVMVALGTSLIVTLAFLRTQATSLQIRQNSLRADLALQAAHTGAAVGLQRIHNASWAGVSETLARDVQSDDEGTSSYSVEFVPTEQDVDDAGLRLVIRSTGVWQSLQHAEDRMEKTVDVEVRLLPRLTGRTINAGDSSNADDQVPIESWFSDSQAYAVFARGSGSTLQSLSIDPGGRIDGNVYIRKILDPYEKPLWSSTIRTKYMQSVANLYVSGSTISSPHPFNGSLTFNNAPDSQLVTDLTNLQVPYTTTATLPSYPNNIVLSEWVPYRMYAGGFQYDGVEVASTLQNVTLGPTPDNPLGIFYNSGNITLYNNVTVQGTIVSFGRVTIDGESVKIASVNWRDAGGSAYVDNVDLWPRMPAIVATRVQVERGSQLSVDGAIFAHTEFIGGGGTFQYTSATDVNITGTATAELSAQPLSVVHLQGTPNLSSLDAAQNYAIWLQEGTTGTWHPIVGVNNTSKTLTVVGEVVHTSPTSYQIRRNRQDYVEIRGPLMTKLGDLRRPDSWNLTSTQWSERHSTWQTVNTARALLGLPALEFVSWLADPSNFSTWSAPYNQYGMTLQPTFHVKHSGGTKYQWKPMLFDDYDGTGPNAEFAGYRWEVISWKELR